MGTRLETAAVDFVHGDGINVVVLKASRIDCIDHAAIFCLALTKGLATAGFTESMIDGVLVEAIRRECVFALLKCESASGHKPKLESFALTMRTIAFQYRFRRAFRLELHCTTVTTTLKRHSSDSSSLNLNSALALPCGSSNFRRSSVSHARNFQRT